MSNYCFCCCLQGGMYVFQMFDYYACNGACILFLSVFETLALGWIFGRYAIFKGLRQQFNIQPPFSWETHKGQI